MKALLIVLLLGVGFPSLRAEEFLSSRESLGKLKIDQKGDEVIRLLGKPASKGKDEMWEAIGDWVQEWNFPEQGVQLNMASEKKGGPKTILTITALPNCKLSTARGISVGSSETAVKKAYGSVRDKEQSVPGKCFVAGSIYGGVIFDIEDGKVIKIFIGAAAE